MYRELLQTSRICNWTRHAAERLRESARESLLCALILLIVRWTRMLLRGSFFVKCASGFADWFGESLRTSLLVNRFLRLKDRTAVSEGSLAYRAFGGLTGGLNGLLCRLRLIRPLSESMFANPFPWCLLTVFLAPLIPTMAALALVLVTLLSLLIRLSLDRARVLDFSVNKYICLFALIYGLAAVLSVTPRSSLPAAAMTLCFALFCLVIQNSIRTPGQLRGLVVAIVCAGVLVSLYGFYQFLFQEMRQSGWLDQEMFEDVIFRAYSTLQNPNVLGEYFLLVFPLSVALLITAKSGLRRFFCVLAAGCMLVCLLLTYSRGCYLGLLLGMALFLVLLDRRFIALYVIGLLTAFLLMPGSILSRFLSIGDMSDTSTSYRVSIWMGTLAMLKDFWFSGVGPGEAAFNLIYPHYAYNAVVAQHSHNLFLQLLCDTGIMGLMAFLMILYHYFKHTFAAMRRFKKGEVRVFAAAGIAGVTGFLAQSMADYTFYNYRVMLMFWAVIAITLLYARGGLSESNTRGNPDE